MKVTLANIKNMEASLDSLLKKELNIRVAYRLSKLAKQIYNELVIFEDNRIKLIKKYGSFNKESQVFEIDPKNQKNIDAFTSEFNQLISEEVDINFQPISLEDLEDIKLSAIDMMHFNNFIIEDQNKEQNK